jgi:hypothetical protein
VPPLAARQRPGLTETLPLFWRHPTRCQACGRDVPADGAPPAARWSECDAWDRKQTPAVLLVLCAECSDELVDPHPRMYLEVYARAPVTGAMALCVDCRHRGHRGDPLRCAHPDAPANGGAGLAVTIEPPHTGHICGRGRHGPGCRTFVHYPTPATACAGREAPDVP